MNQEVLTPYGDLTRGDKVYYKTRGKVKEGIFLASMDKALLLGKTCDYAVTVSLLDVERAEDDNFEFDEGMKCRECEGAVFGLRNQRAVCIDCGKRYDRK